MKSRNVRYYLIGSKGKFDSYLNYTF